MSTINSTDPTTTPIPPHSHRQKAPWFSYDPEIFLPLCTFTNNSTPQPTLTINTQHTHRCRFPSRVIPRFAQHYENMLLAAIALTRSRLAAATDANHRARLLTELGSHEDKLYAYKQAGGSVAVVLRCGSDASMTRSRL